MATPGPCAGTLSGLAGWGRRLLAFRRTRYSFVVLCAVLLGLGGGGAAIAFRYLIELATWVFTGGQAVESSGFAELPWWWLLPLPVLGGVLVGLLTTRLAPEAAGTGVPEVMEAVALRQGAIRKRVGLVKALAVALCLGSGGSAGREGPIVHVGAALGSLVGGLLRVPGSLLRTFVGCGAAAGIAATFNAPIAGALFAGEVILGHFGVVSFAAIVISSVVATVLSRHFIGDFPAFVVPAFSLHHWYELFFYAVLGLLAAVVGAGFIVVLDRVRGWFEKTPTPAWLRPALGGIGVGGLGLLLPAVLGVGYGPINQALHGSTGWELMALLLVAKLLATCLTLGSGGSGGIFAPSLFVGAMLGGLVGSVVASVAPGVSGSVGSYALVAMGAVVAATTRAPITAMVIIFEMTNNYSIVLPLMVASILAVLLAAHLVRPSIYETKLLARGIDLSNRRDRNILRRFKVADVEWQAARTVELSASLADILRLAMEHGDRHYVVCDSDSRYVGLIHLADLRHFFFNEERLGGLVVAADLVHQDVPVLRPDDTLDLALRLLEHRELDALPVLDPEEPGKVLGLVSQDAVIEAYNRHLLAMDMAGEVAGLVVGAERAGTVDLGQGSRLVEIETPAGFTGKSIGELDLRRRFGVQAVLVKRASSAGKQSNFIVPEAGTVLARGDVMLLIGSDKAIKKMLKSAT